MSREYNVSGPIFWTDDRTQSHPDGSYKIVNAIGHGWGIPTRNITPDDLREMADHLEFVRNSRGEK